MCKLEKMQQGLISALEKEILERTSAATEKYTSAFQDVPYWVMSEIEECHKAINLLNERKALGRLLECAEDYRMGFIDPAAMVARSMSTLRNIPGDKLLHVFFGQKELQKKIQDLARTIAKMFSGTEDEVKAMKAWTEV